MCAWASDEEIFWKGARAWMNVAHASTHNDYYADDFHTQKLCNQNNRFMHYEYFTLECLRRTVRSVPVIQCRNAKCLPSSENEPFLLLLLLLNLRICVYISFFFTFFFFVRWFSFSLFSMTKQVYGIRTTHHLLFVRSFYWFSISRLLLICLWKT